MLDVGILSRRVPGSSYAHIERARVPKLDVAAEQAALVMVKICQRNLDFDRLLQVGEVSPRESEIPAECPCDRRQERGLAASVLADHEHGPPV